jgi:hypothetical protein
MDDASLILVGIARHTSVIIVGLWYLLSSSQLLGNYATLGPIAFLTIESFTHFMSYGPMVCV